MLIQIILFLSAFAFTTCAVIAAMEIYKTKKKQNELDDWMRSLPDKETAEKEHLADLNRFQQIKERHEVESKNLAAKLVNIRVKVDAQRRDLEENSKREIAEINSNAEEQNEQASRTLEQATLKLEQAKTAMREANAFLRENADVLIPWEHGFIPEIFSFDDPQQYKDAIRSLEEDIKNLIRDGKACQVAVMALFENKRENDRFSKDMTKLVIQAFNAASSEINSEVSPSNFISKSNKLDKAYEKLNSTCSVYGVVISDNFRIKKQEMLKLVFQYELKRKEQQEYEREIRAQQREEAKLEKERKLAIEEAEREEHLASEAYAKAEREIQAKLAAVAEENEEERNKLRDELSSIKEELAAAREKAERAKSQAELTKTGHVYVLSNLGTMGERVYKVGMTRRLEPMDRVKELSDASVPFLFDCHCMLATDDAPGLEKALHRELREFRVNKVNLRKEFFKCDLETITQAVVKHNGELPDRFIYEPLAEEYYASVGYAELETNPPARSESVD